MKIELNDQEIQDLLRILGEVPAKHSYMLLRLVSHQVAEENKQRVLRDVHPPSSDPAFAGVSPPAI